MRGFAAVTDFAYRMLSVLNHPRNAAKGCWSQMTFDDLVDKLHEERRQVDAEIALMRLGSGDIRRLVAECTDEANVLMMIADNMGER
jgi:hypothetical protein